MDKKAKEQMAKALDQEIGKWLSGNDQITWESAHHFPDGFLQKNLLAVDHDEGKITILRAWMSSPDSPAAVSVDLSLPYEDFAGPINEDAFPHAEDGHRGLEHIFRSHLSAEHVEMVWQNSPDETFAAFVARSAKVGRDEHVIAGTVIVENGIANTEIVFRQELATLRPESHRTLAR